MGPDCIVENGIPKTQNDHYTLADLNQEDQITVLNWVKDNILPDRSSVISHGTIKSQIEHDAGVYITGNQMKHAMLQCGFYPIDESEWYWEFNAISLKNDVLNHPSAYTVKSGLGATEFDEYGNAKFPDPIIDRINNTGIFGGSRSLLETVPQEDSQLIISNGLGLYYGSLPPERRLFIQPPLYRNRIAEILVDDLNIIRFEDNRFAIKTVLEIQINRRVSQLLGLVAEAVLVHRCWDNAEVNERWLRLARYSSSRCDDAHVFRALGTGFHSTKLHHKWQYNPSDKQRDIVWVDSNEYLALMDGGNTFAGRPAGLQVKTSEDGLNYILDDLRKANYGVPIAYVALNDDYEKVLEKAPGIRPGIDLIDVREVDTAAYYEIKQYAPLIYGLLNGRISPEDVIREASEPVLQSALLANTMQFTNTSIILK